MSPAAVEIGSPESVYSHDQRTMDPSFSGIGNGIQFGFGVGSVENTKSRTKPRLVRLRKNGRKVKGSSFSGEILSGFNPFAPTSKDSLHMNGESPGDKGFVFGANGNSANGEATSVGKVSVTPVSDEEEFSTPIGDYNSGSESTKEHSDEVLGKRGNDKPENIRRCSESTSFKAENGVGFDSGKRVDDSEMNLLAEMEKLNIGDARHHGGNGYEEARKFDNDFVFGSSGKVDAKYNGAATSGPWSFSSDGIHQSDNVTNKRPASQSDAANINNLTSTTFDDFKAPQWDPSSLKNSLFPEVSRNPGHVRRNRLSKDKRSKKVKEKMKQHEPNRCEVQASEGVESKEQLSSPGYCSPMDFSPYRGEKASNQCPTGPPLTSTDTSHSREHVNSCSSNHFTADGHGSSCVPNFSFSASTSEGKIPYNKLQAVKKYRRKVNKFFPKNNLNAMRNNQENQPVNTSHAKQESGSTSVMPGVCEVWRLRGNQAYKNGDMCKAEECYTYGINSSPSSDDSEYSVKPLALCYGNRAAARISLGRLREAISDCEMAASLDPSYIKAYMRAANCYLVLGELGSAVQYFNKCMESASSVCLDRRTTIESAEGLQQAQKVADYTNCASVFLEKRTPDGASDALVSIANALLISSCSDKLLQMKAEALLMIRHYKEVIELCENTLQTAEKNFVSAGPVGMTNVDRLGSKHHSLIVWRWNMISKSHFYLGNLEMALEILEKLQQVESSRNENQEESRDSPSSLVATISELLRYKNAGNEAVRTGKYMEAVEQYTAALSKNVDSRPFAAICFCNRAAANHYYLR